MGLVAGIDLGTTNSAIALVDGQGRPQILPNSEDKATTPSVICFRDGEIIVGERAKELQALGTWPVAAFFKRQMGDPDFLFHADGVDYTAVDLSALVLRKVKADAEARTGAPVTRAVITVPAYFRDRERKATMAAGALAGLEVLQVINEPTAAAAAYGFSHREAGRRLLVYDLGGGTFDVTLLELTPDGVLVRSSEGDHQLGGKDWDDRIVAYLAARFQEEFGLDPLIEVTGIADLLILAEEAKIKLTALDSTNLVLTHQGLRGRYRLDRATFEELTADLLLRTASMMARVLEDQRLRPDLIDGVLPVGGATRMPMVRRHLMEYFGKAPLGGLNVDEAVALGAALVAAERRASLVPDPGGCALCVSARTSDVTNHSLGMIALNADGSAYINSIILPKNIGVPCQEMRPYQQRTRARGGNRIEVFMTQGETGDPGQADYTGKFVIQDIPHQASGVTVVEITYHYDRSGTVKVLARAQGAELPVTVEDLPQNVRQRFLEPPTQPGVREHITAYLAFDLSGSMGGEPLNQAKEAARGFLRNMDLAHGSMGVIAFSDFVRTKLPACQNACAIKKAIEDLQVGETGGGNDANPFDAAFANLASVKGKRVLIALTDGMWSNPQVAVQAARNCRDSGVEVIAVGFGCADREFLRAVASSDEASFFTSLDGLVDTFSSIAQELTASGSLSCGGGFGLWAKP